LTIKTWWVFHPVTIFTGTLIAIGSALVIFIRSYLQVSDSLLSFIKKYNIDPDQFQDNQSWVIILLICLLVAATLFGVALIFIYYQKLIRLYRFQQNFINGFTHELKTPIASLRLYLDTFKKYDLDRDEQTKYIEYMIRDTERLTLNVNQILQIAKIEDKNFTPTFRSVDIVRFIESFFSKNPHYFEDLILELNSSKIGSCDINIEPDLFEMIIMNIVTNTLNYGSSDTPKLEINFSIYEDNLSIEFKDNGIGIDKSEFKNVFKKMYQIGKTTKGSGLGLYLSSSIIKIHKGKIRVSSKGLGKGSTFTVILPLVKAHK
jgi:two-component system phosphate regulon sensor histidine kinase PhoR